MSAHEVVENGETYAVCRCGERIEADTHNRVRIAHARHALKNHHDYRDEPDEDGVPF